MLQPSRSHQPHKRCPECGSERVWCDGVRQTATGPIQRYLCRLCGFRFSESTAHFRINGGIVGQIFKQSNPGKDLSQANILQVGFPVQPTLKNSAFQGCENVGSHNASLVTVPEKRLNTFRVYNRERLVCVSESEAKNLATVEPQISKAGAGATLDVKGYLINYEFKMVLKGLKPQTILQRLSVLRLLVKRGVNLLDPESAYKAIDHAKRYNPATKELEDREWSDGSKTNAAKAYKTFCQAVGIRIAEDINFDKWYGGPQKLPWIPLETEIDQLIAGCSRKTAAFLQLLKETWCRSGEAARLEWQDVDPIHNVITINSPEKNGLPRQFKASSKLIAMLNTLPKKDRRVFGTSTLTRIRQHYGIQRAKIAYKLQNPRLRNITFHTLRHWGATMEYHRTKDILHVQERLGHRSITNTLIYTHLVNFEGDEYHTATASTLQGDEALLKTGFEYVTDRDGVKIYRKRK